MKEEKKLCGEMNVFGRYFESIVALQLALYYKIKIIVTKL